MGLVVGAVEDGRPLGAPLAFMGAVFVLLQVLASDPPGGQREPREPYRRVPPRSPHARVRAATRHGSPRAPGARQRPDMARDFDIGMTGPPLAISMDFIAIGLVDMVGGIAQAILLARYRVVGCPRARRRVARDALAAARELDLARPQHRRSARGAAPRRILVPARSRRAGFEGGPPVRPPRLDGRAVRRSPSSPVRPPMARHPAARAVGARELGARPRRQRARVLVAGRRGDVRRASRSRSSSCSPPPPSGRARSRSADGAGRSTAPRSRRPRPCASSTRWRRSAPCRRVAAIPPGCPRARSVVRDLTFAYETDDRPVLEGLDLTIPAGTSLAIVGQNGAGKTTFAKLLCRLYDPQRGAIEVDGFDLRELDLDAWRSRVTAVFQDFIRFEWSLRANVAPDGAPDADIRAALGAGRRGRSRRARHRVGTRATRAAPTCRAGSGNASRSPARCARYAWVPASCSSTSPPRSSTSAAKRRSSTASSRRRVTARRSSSRTASRPCATPTGSACSKAGGSSSSVRTTS